MSKNSPDPTAVDRRLARDPIAIVGLAGRFPKARDVQEFWDNVVSARDCSDVVPDSWWNSDDYYDPDPFAEDKTYCRRGGFLTPELFDPLDFGMPPKTLDSTGLVQLLSLVVAREALRDADCGRDKWHDPARAGVVLGVCGTNSTLIPLASRLLVPQMAKAMAALGVPQDLVDLILRTRLAALPPWTEDSFPGILGNVVSGRIANRLNLGAANHTVDAACASSLAAVRSAVDELVSRRADVMLTGGCDADNSLISFMCFSKTPALSLTGQVRPFDAEADGTLVGEGIGILVLKRLADAERDGDRIYAVLRGLGSSSDGRAQSIYAPCGEGQLTALRRAYLDADCPPHSVELIEAHGTGTPVGDEVELSALNDLLATGAGEDSRFAAVGSVKSQIGHTKAAAGAAGMIKAALSLHHRLLPPTINVRTPNAQASREDGALYLNTAARPWILSPSRPVRRAGVSAFGFGGVNYHAVLEEYTAADERRERPLHTAPQAFLWHEEDAAALLRRLERGDTPSQGPVPAAHARIGFVAAGEHEYTELLALAVKLLRSKEGRPHWKHPSGIHYRSTALPPEAGVGALFAGQGSQYVDMGLGAALAVPPVRAAFDMANALFPVGDTLAQAVFPPPGTGDPDLADERLRRTGYAQSAIGALSMGQFQYLRELGLVPQAVLGHSFGELTALWSAGVLDNAAFTKLARARGLAMEQPDSPGAGDDPGTMVSVRLESGVLEEALAQHPGLSISARNAPEEYTLGGPTPDTAQFIAWCVERGLRPTPLKVAAAFHTPLVHHAVEAFEAACADTDFTAPTLRVHSGTAGAVYRDDPEANRRTLVQALRQPVDFASRIEEMYADGIRVFVEFGPARTLAQLVERILADREVEVISCDAGPGTDSAVALQQAALRLAVLGIPLSLTGRHNSQVRQPRPEPSRAARVLDGPLFAVERLRPAYEQLVADLGPQAFGSVSETDPLPIPAPAPQLLPAGQLDPLTRAAAEHLAAHTRYLDGQLRTAEQLTGLLQQGGAPGRLDESLAMAVHAIAEHSLGMGEAHTRAGEVVARLLRLPDDGQLPPWQSEPPATSYSHSSAREAGAVLALPRQGGSPTGLSASVDDHRDKPVKSALAELWEAEQNGGEVLRATIAASDVDPEELERVFRAVIAEKTGYDIDMIEPDMYIQEDLGIDSLKQVEIGAEMWRRYPVIGRSEMYRFSEARTVGDLTRMLKEVITRPTTQLQPAAPRTDVGPVYVMMRQLPDTDICAGLYPDQPQALLIDDGGALSAALATALSSRGWEVRRVILPGAGSADSDHQALADWDEETLSANLAGQPRLDLCVLPFSRDVEDDAARTIQRLCHSVLVVKHVRVLLETAAATGTRAALVTVTQLDGALGYAGAGGDPVRALAGGIGGLIKTAALEAPTLFCRALDFAPDLDTDDVGAAFAAEIVDLATDVREIGLDTAGRRAPEVSRTPAPLFPPTGKDIELTEEDLLVVTGGAGGITSWCTQALAKAHSCGYLLLGRTPLQDEPDWAIGLESAEELREALENQAREAGEDPTTEATADRIERQGQLMVRQREMRSTLDTLRSHGVEAHYLAADVRDAAQVASALAPYAARITGVVHGAGILSDRPLSQVKSDRVTAVVETKLAGLANVLDALDRDRLRHLVLFSSVTGIWGNLRQSDYALANEALNRFGCAFQAANPRCRVVPIAWGPWAGGMAAAIHQMFADAGVPVLSRAQGTAHFLDRMASGTQWSGVTVVGPTTPFYHRIERLPDEGRTALRSLTGLGDEPMLRDHSYEQVPILPMTAAVGWAVNAVERALGGGQTAIGCEDFRITHSISFPPEHPTQFRIRLTRQADPATTHVLVENADHGGRARYDGLVRLADRAVEPPRITLPDFAIADRPHPGYQDGRLFHGPTLAGLHNVLADEQNLFVVAAQLPDPEFAHGAYAGSLYSPALADLLLQAELLKLRPRATSPEIPVPISFERLELFTPLPDGEPFAIVVEVHDDDTASPFFSECTLTAAAPDGLVHQRWTRVRMLWVTPRALIDGIARQATVDAEDQG